MSNDETDRHKEALEQIVQWSEAYPLNAFPEPDFAKARELLAAGGITIDAVSASMARHVIRGVGDIARRALDGEVVMVAYNGVWVLVVADGQAGAAPPHRLKIFPTQNVF